MESSIFTAEVCAIDLALNIISRDKQQIYHILRFALCIKMENKKLEDLLIVKLLSRLDSMSCHKKIFVLDS